MVEAREASKSASSAGRSKWLSSTTSDTPDTGAPAVYNKQLEDNKKSLCSTSAAQDPPTEVFEPTSPAAASRCDNPFLLPCPTPSSAESAPEFLISSENNSSPRELVRRARKIHELQEQLTKCNEESAKRGRGDEQELQRLKVKQQCEKRQLDELKTERTELQEAVAKLKDQLERLNKEKADAEMACGISENNLNLCLQRGRRQALDELVELERSVADTRVALDAYTNCLRAVADAIPPGPEEAPAPKPLGEADSPAAAAYLLRALLLYHAIVARFQLNERHCEQRVFHADECTKRAEARRLEIQQQAESLATERHLHEKTLALFQKAKNKCFSEYNRRGGRIAAANYNLIYNEARAAELASVRKNAAKAFKADLIAERLALNKDKEDHVREYKKRLADLTHREELSEQKVAAATAQLANAQTTLNQSNELYSSALVARSEADKKRNETEELRVRVMHGFTVIQAAHLEFVQAFDGAVEIVKELQRSLGLTKGTGSMTSQAMLTNKSKGGAPGGKGTTTTETGGAEADLQQVVTSCKEISAKLLQMMKQMAEVKGEVAGVDAAQRQLSECLSGEHKATSLAEAMRKLKEESIAAKTDVATLTNKKAVLEKELKAMKNALEEARGEVNEAQKSKEALLEEKALLEESKKHVFEALETSQKEACRLEATTTTLQNDISDLQNKVSRLRSEEEKLVKLVKEQEELERNMDSRLHAIKREKADHEEDLKKLQRKAAELEKKLLETEGRVDKVSADVDCSKVEGLLSEEVQRLQQEKEQLLGEVRNLEAQKARFLKETAMLAAKLQRRG